MSEQRNIWHGSNILEGILEETEPGHSFSQLGLHLSQHLSLALFPNQKRPPSWEGMYPRPIGEQTQWIDLVLAGSSTAWDHKWWWLQKYVWDHFKSPNILNLRSRRINCHKSTENPASISNILSLWSRVFCSDSNQNNINRKWVSNWLIG